VPEQFVLWLADVARGDLGRSFRDRRPVATTIAERLGPTVALNLGALSLTIGIGLPLGALAAQRPGSRIDRWSAIAGYAAYAVPVFWAALVLQTVFAVRLDLLPLQGLASDAARDAGPAARLLDRAAHLVLPAVALGYGGAAWVARFVRANLLEAALPEAARAARARGLSPAAVLVRHGLRQASVPLLTLAGFLVPSLVGGSVLIETVFNIPGVGLLFFDAVQQRDIPLVLGVTLLSGVATLAGIVAADLLYVVVDPRVRRRA
jgi:peptide/nickel transport system permease protein